MKRIVKMLALLSLCVALTACAQEMTVVAETGTVVEETAMPSVSEEMSETLEEEEAEIVPKTAENTVPVETEVESEEIEVEETETEVVEMEETQTEPVEEEPSEEPEISDEELASVLQAYENWKAEQERIAAGIVEETYESEVEWDPAPVVQQVTRTEEEVLQFVSNFVANYKNTESFRSLEGEGIEYLEDCLNVMRTDPASEPDIASYMEKYRTGTYDDEMFQFMLECWIEFGGSFGEGCIITVQ